MKNLQLNQICLAVCPSDENLYPVCISSEPFETQLRYPDGSIETAKRAYKVILTSLCPINGDEDLDSIVVPEEELFPLPSSEILQFCLTRSEEEESAE